jgi:hypothetical protein
VNHQKGTAPYQSFPEANAARQAMIIWIGICIGKDTLLRTLCQTEAFLGHSPRYDNPKMSYESCMTLDCIVMGSPM